MAISAGPCGKTGLLPGFKKAMGDEATEVVLGHKKMFSGTQTKMPGMGISSRSVVLVY